MTNTSYVDAALQDIAALMQAELIKALQHTGHGSSMLAKSIKYNITDNVVILSMNEYGIFLDEGSCGELSCGGRGVYLGKSTPKKRKMPPVSTLERYSGNPWAIAKSIQKHGTKAYPFLYVLKPMKDTVTKILTIAGYKDITSVMNKYIKKL